MDILMWALYHHQRYSCRTVLAVWDRLSHLVSGGVLVNQSACLTAMLELYRSSYPPDGYVLMGSASDPAPLIKSLPDSIPVIIGGNAREQAQVRTLEQRENWYYLELSGNTHEEAERAVKQAFEFQMTSLAVAVQDVHCLRAMATFIKVLSDIGQSQFLRLIPHPILITGREDLPQSLKNLAVVIEAWKLWKYQRCGHIAKLDEIIRYVRLVTN